MSEAELAILDNDPAYHAYALRDIMADFMERFGRDLLLSTLQETLSSNDIQVISHVSSAD